MKWTNHSNILQPSVLFATLATARIISLRLDHIYSGYQHVAILLSSHDRTQDFLCYDEHQTNRVDERPIKDNFINDFMNYMPLPRSAYEMDVTNKSTPNQDQLQLLNVSIIAPGGLSPLFENISISIPRGKLTVVVGITASGKTQFLKGAFKTVPNQRV